MNGEKEFAFFPKKSFILTRPRPFSWRQKNRKSKYENILPPIQKLGLEKHAENNYFCGYFLRLQCLSVNKSCLQKKSLDTKRGSWKEYRVEDGKKALTEGREKERAPPEIVSGNALETQTRGGELSNLAYNFLFLN